MIIGSGIDWFDDDVYIGSSLSLPSGVWRLERKIHEHEYYKTQADVEELDLLCEARGVFSCSKVSGSGPETAIIKIRLQIPWFDTKDHGREIRAKQAAPTPERFS